MNLQKTKNLLKSQGQRRLNAVLIVCVIILFIIIITKDPKVDKYGSFKKPLQPFRLIVESLESSVMPTPGRTIFFHETTCNQPDSEYRTMNLTARQACAIESAALRNPNFEVFVMLTCPSYRPISGVERNLIDVIESYGNVHLRQLNMSTYAAGTPIEDWVKKGELINSSYPMQHTADLLRLISLYRFGGIYMDMDVVVLRSLEDVPLNYLGLQDSETVCNAVLGLEPNGKGHEFAKLMLEEYEKNYNGNGYTSNGPALMTRVVKTICGEDLGKTRQENYKSCQGLQVFNSTAFYAIPWPAWKLYTDPKHVKGTMEKTKDSYLIHLWNRVSSKELIRVGSNTAYGKYAEKHCPKAYAAAGEYF